MCYDPIRSLQDWHWPWLSVETGGWSECGRVVCTCFRASVMRSRFILCQQIAQTYWAHLTGALLVWATAVLCGVSGRPESHRSSCVSWCLVLLQNFIPCPFSYSESIPILFRILFRNLFRNVKSVRKHFFSCIAARVRDIVGQPTGILMRGS